MEMDGLAPAEWGLILVVTVILAAILLVVSRLIRGVTRVLIRALERFVPRRVAVATGLAAVTFVVLGLVQGVLVDGLASTMNSAYSVIDRSTEPWISEPTSTLRSGGPDSLVAWDTLGKKGRAFTGEGGGPTTAEIAELRGEPAMEPIRVYVGLRSAGSLDARVELAMAELDRTGAFDRSVLAVMTTTGTGWVDENVADSLELLHGGDTASVALQYSYLPSWVSFLVDRSEAAGAGRELIGAVSERIAQLPEDDRPQLLVFGESLGSYGTEEAFADLDDLLARTDGAFLVGPTFTNPLHTELVDGRDDGSPAWRPVVDGGASVRFAVQPGDLEDDDLYPSSSEWGRPRVVYLQNASDPITYFDPALLWSAPAWLDGPRGPDVSGGMAWIPVVTFWQVAADMAFAMDVPAGHGHRYGSNVVDGWVALSAPEGWTEADTEALRDAIDERAEARDRRKAAAD